MPEPLKTVIIELAGVAAIVGGCWSLFTGNPLGLVALLTGQRLLLHPAEVGTRFDRLLELTAKVLKRGPSPRAEGGALVGAAPTDALSRLTNRSGLKGTTVVRPSRLSPG